MQSKKNFRNLISRTIAPAATIALAIATVFALTVALTQPTSAQTFKVIHTFTGGADGGSPMGDLTIDNAGNLYGTAANGGADGNGTVYKLSHKGSGWVFTPLYSFQALPDGANPYDGVVFGPDGSLYGTTFGGGSYGLHGDGTVFNLRPAATACKTALCPWTETLLHQFASSPDGDSPEGYLIFDRAGSLYGTTFSGGQDGCGQYQYPCGTVFELTPSENGWTETVLHIFRGDNDGNAPGPGLIFDQSGNLYGTTLEGGSGGVGTVFEMTPSGNQWTNTVLYAFQDGNDGSYPLGGLIFDHSGNLYGTTSAAGAHSTGTVFKLTPSNGQWTLTVLYAFQGADGDTPKGSLVMDAAGSLYGTTNWGGASGCGTVFKLTPSGGGWTHTSLHDFTCGADGGQPWNVTPIFDANGNLYGTATRHGLQNNGVVWEITP